jgi:uncharacterized membrane protein YfcA
MTLDVPALQLVLAALVVAASAFVQGSVGFGYALVAAPTLALVSERFVPGPIMVSSFVLSAATGWRERHCIDRRGVGVALLARAPGVLLAGVATTVLTLHTLNVVFGVTVLLAVAISASGLRVKLSTPALLLAGFSSGLMGTLVAIGGPPMALVYQDAEGPTLRATLNTYFAVGSLMSIATLAWVGRFGVSELLIGALLLPPVGVGFALSGAIRHVLDRGYTRRAVLAIASVSALGVVVKTLLR